MMKYTVYYTDIKFPQTTHCLGATESLSEAKELVYDEIPSIIQDHKTTTLEVTINEQHEWDERRSENVVWFEVDTTTGEIDEW